MSKELNQRTFLKSAVVTTAGALSYLYLPKGLSLSIEPENEVYAENMRPFQNDVGWAYTAVPGTSRDSMIADMARMKSLGANIVYIGHANPGDVSLNSPEPGLSPAVYFALRDGSSKANDASSIYQAIIDSLDASKAVGLDVVLPIGYQIQMGADWNAQNQDSLRLDSNGNNLDFWGSGPTASPYSPIYQRDIREYYQWINTNLVNKYPNIVALNLGDEPMGSDFSHWAKEEFARRYNTNFDSAPQEQRGQFLSEVIADHASLSANMWKEINPSVWTMMTFHIQRDRPWLPNLEALFSKTPDTFVFSSDTHLHDAPTPPKLSLVEQQDLYAMVRTESFLSKAYNRPMMLWTSTNAWGLSAYGEIVDADRNFDIVHDISKQGGGKLAMLMAWGWNIKGQGVYGYEGAKMFDPDEMIARMSEKMRTVKDDLSIQIPTAQPLKVLYLPSGELYRRLGQDNVSYLAPEPGYVDLTQYDLVQDNIIYLNDGPALDQAWVSGAQIIPAL